MLCCLDQSSHDFMKALINLAPGLGYLAWSPEELPRLRKFGARVSAILHWTPQRCTLKGSGGRCSKPHVISLVPAGAIVPESLTMVPLRGEFSHQCCGISSWYSFCNPWISSQSTLRPMRMT